MSSGKMVERYSNLEAWLHDYVIADHALNLHAVILEQSKMYDVFAEKRERIVLDVGCGGGQSALRLKERYPQLKLTAVDLSESQIARAQKRAKQQGCDVQFEVADAQVLPFPDQRFDVVYSFGSVKHWPDPLKGIGECWRVLKAGGELLLTDSTSDATKAHIKSFFRIAKFPGLLERPVVALFARFMVRNSRPLSTYQQIATQLGMPEGTVSLPSYMPSFLFRTQKPIKTG